MKTSVDDAVRAKLAAEWSGCDLAWPNETYEPTTETPWAYCEVQGNGSTRTAFNSAGKRVGMDDGLLMIDVFVPVGIGDRPAKDLAQGIAEVFAMQNFAGEDCRIVGGVPFVGEGEAGSDDGLWFRVSASVPLTATYFI